MLSMPRSPLWQIACRRYWSGTNVAKLLDIASKKGTPRRPELLFLMSYQHKLTRLRTSLKCLLAAGYEAGAIEPGAMQHLIDHFELWSE